MCSITKTSMDCLRIFSKDSYRKFSRKPSKNLSRIYPKSSIKISLRDCFRGSEVSVDFFQKMFHGLVYRFLKIKTSRDFLRTSSKDSFKNSSCHSFRNSFIISFIDSFANYSNVSVRSQRFLEKFFRDLFKKSFRDSSINISSNSFQKFSISSLQNCKMDNGYLEKIIEGFLQTFIQIIFMAILHELLQKFLLHFLLKFFQRFSRNFSPK